MADYERRLERLEQALGENAEAKSIHRRRLCGDRRHDTLELSRESVVLIHPRYLPSSRVWT